MAIIQQIISSFSGTVVDSSFKNISLLLSTTGTNNAQNNSFVDSGPQNWTITRSGNTTQGSFSPYSQTGWSLYYNANGQNLGFGAGSAAAVDMASVYTLEGWFMMPDFGSGAAGSSGNRAIMCTSSGTGANSNIRTWGFSNSTTVYLSTRDHISYISITLSSALTPNVWFHLAFVSNGGSGITVYVNGVAAGSTTDNTTYAGSTGITAFLGSGTGNGVAGFIGNMSNIRFSNVARYSSTFTPQTSAFVSDANTTLLTAQSNRFVDNGPTHYTITPSSNNGSSPVISAFGPYVPPISYSTPSVGGSGYFDGTGDYLTTPTSGQFTPTGDFTIGVWIYATALTAPTPTNAIMGNYTGNNTTDWMIEIFTGGVLRVYINGSTARIVSSAGVISTNEWMYIAVARSGSTITAYVNGVAVGSQYTFSGTVGDPAKTIVIGNSNNSAQPFTGYISDVRLVDGTAISSVPAMPSTSTGSNTKLLLNFTNSGIYDNSSKLNLETRGNAKVSTSIVKYGSGSLSLAAAGDYLWAPNNPAFNFSTGSFTVEMWVNITSYVNTSCVLCAQGGTTSTAADVAGWSCSLSNTGVLTFNLGTTIVSSAAAAFTTGSWHHIAFARNGTSFKMFIDGTQVGSTTTNSTDLTSLTEPFTIGTDHALHTAYPVTGFISQLRITKGVARYISNFTAPTASFPTL